MIFNKINNILESVLEKNNFNKINYNIEKTKDTNFGDFSTNIAMTLAKDLKKNPMEVAEIILNNINKEEFEKIEIAKPGFINFFLNEKEKSNLIKEIITKKDEFPVFDKTNKVYNIEFVSANPTGLLHVGHARNAVFGDSLSRIMTKAGNKIIKEYLINDAGNQMNKLAYSVLVRYKQLNNIDIQLVEDAYHGQEVFDVAKKLLETKKQEFINVEIQEDKIVDKSINDYISKFARDEFIEIIKSDLKFIGVEFDLFFSEKFDHEKDVLNKTIEQLKKYTFIKDNALWLRTTEFGDDKDRVLIKSDKSATYFLPDIAYHLVKIKRNNPDKLINIWGADHHSYIDRMMIAMKMLGYENKLEVICMQLVRLMKDNKEFKLSKRTGQSLTLLELAKTIGKDALRWFLVSVSANTHIELDINLALSKDNKNPIYYVEYAHARAYNLLTKFTNNKIDLNNFNISLLNNELEKELINYLMVFKNTIQLSSINKEPSRLTNYLWNLSKVFHSYYSNVNILNADNEQLINTRVCLVECVKIILKNGLDLLGIEAYTSM